MASDIIEELERRRAARRRRRLGTVAPQEEPQEEGLISGAKDFASEIVKDVIDVPSRVAAIPEFAVRELGVGFESPRQREEIKRKAIGGAIDVGTFLIPAGPIVKGARLLGKGVAKAAGRGALAATKASPFFTPRETASDPGERAKDVAVQAGFGAAFPGVAGVVGNRLAKGQSRLAQLVQRRQGAKEARALQRLGALTEREVDELGKRGILSTKQMDQIKTELVENKKLIDDQFRETAKALEGKTVEELTSPDAVRELQKEFAVFQGRWKPNIDAIVEGIRTGTSKKFAKSKKSTLINEARFKNFQKEGARLIGRMTVVAKKVQAEGKAGARQLAEKAQIVDNLLRLTKKWQAARSTWGRTGRQMQKASEEMQTALESLMNLGQVERRDSILKEIFTGQIGLNKQGMRELVRYWSINIFPIWSSTRDFLTNFSAVSSEASQGFAADIFDLAVGKGVGLDRTKALFNAVRMTPLRASRSRLGPAVTEALDSRATAMGELLPIFHSKLDRIAFFPAQAKRGVDAWFKRFGTMSYLQEKALKQAQKEFYRGSRKKLSGSALTERVDDLFKQFIVDEKMIAEAVERGNRFGFNRVLSDVEEQISRAASVRLFVNPFPRWQMQFTRFLVEHTPMDPRFWGKVVKNQATGEDFVKFMVRNMTGMGGVYATSELIYNQVDFDTGDFVREDGTRIKLTGLTPLPDALAMTALIKGDYANFRKIVQESSIPFSSISGILSDFFKSIYDERTLELKDPNMVWRAFRETANDVIPGRGMLAALEQISDPTIREGFWKDVPGLSKLSEERIDPTTGKPIIGKQRLFIPGTKASVDVERAPRGIPFVAGRPTNPVEAELFRLGFGVTRPRRLPELRFTEELGVPQEFQGTALQKRYEEIRGDLIGRSLTRLVQAPGYQALPDENRKEFIRNMLRRISSTARQRVLSEAGIPGTTRRLVSRLREQSPRFTPQRR